MISDASVSADGGSTEEENSAMATAASLGAEQTTAEQAVTATEKPKTGRGGRGRVLRGLTENVGEISKDLSSFRKNYEASASRLEKQVSQLRSEVASLKSHNSKESAGAVKRQEVYLSKILAKLNTEPGKKAKGKK